MKKTRNREHRLELRAPIDAVWKALVDPEEIAKWYAPEVSVEPGEGGRFRLSWGEAFTGEARIVVWKPSEHLRIVHNLDVPVTEDYYLESDGETTVLRLVQSEIPDDEDWDLFFEETNRGWKMFLAGLRHYLERHLGQITVNVTFMQPVPLAVENAWDKLVASCGFGAEPPAVGRRGVTMTAFGEGLESEMEVVVCEPPFTLSVVLAHLDDALLALDFERNGPRTVLFCNLSTFEMEPARIDGLRERFRSWIERLFLEP